MTVFKTLKKVGFGHFFVNYRCCFILHYETICLKKTRASIHTLTPDVVHSIELERAVNKQRHPQAHWPSLKKTYVILQLIFHLAIEMLVLLFTVWVPLPATDS